MTSVILRFNKDDWSGDMIEIAVNFTDDGGHTWMQNGETVKLADKRIHDPDSRFETIVYTLYLRGEKTDYTVYKFGNEENWYCQDEDVARDGNHPAIAAARLLFNIM